MRIPTVVLFAAGLAIAAAAPADFVSLYQAATAAHKAKDFATEKARLKEALALRPGHPAALYQLAAAQARGNEPERALDTLQQLAAMGLSFDPSGDTDFDGLRGAPRYATINGEFVRNREPAGDASG